MKEINEFLFKIVEQNETILYDDNLVEFDTVIYFNLFISNF